MEVARRERVLTDGPKYVIYGIDEDVLWDKIESMDGWWKETTWERLVLRELPETWRSELDMGEVKIDDSRVSLRFVICGSPPHIHFALSSFYSRLRTTMDGHPILPSPSGQTCASRKTEPH